MHDGKLLLVGGVWLHSFSVPGITVIDLITGLCLDYTISVVSTDYFFQGKQCCVKEGGNFRAFS